MATGSTFNMTSATNWNLHYQSDPVTSHLTLPILRSRVLRTLELYSAPNPSIVELGGAGSPVFDRVRQRLNPKEYHLVDNNQYGLDLFRRCVNDPTVKVWNQDVLKLDIPVRADAVFSLGLIGHFDAVGTREAIVAHMRVLKPGGVAVISFPSPTFLYRATRWVSEATGQWIFHDERPLWTSEVEKAIAGRGRLLSEELVWPIFPTQTLVAIRKNG